MLPGEIIKGIWNMQFDFIVNKVFSLDLDQYKESQTPIK